MLAKIVTILRENFTREMTTESVAVSKETSLLLWPGAQSRLHTTLPRNKGRQMSLWDYTPEGSPHLHPQPHALLIKLCLPWGQW